MNPSVVFPLYVFSSLPRLATQFSVIMRLNRFSTQFIDNVTSTDVSKKWISLLSLSSGLTLKIFKSNLFLPNKHQKKASAIVDFPVSFYPRISMLLPANNKTPLSLILLKFLISIEINLISSILFLSCLLISKHFNIGVWRVDPLHFITAVIGIVHLHITIF